MSLGHRPLRLGIAAPLVILLVAAHAVALHHLRSRFAMPTLLAVGVLLVVVATHSGVLGALRERLRRHHE